MSLKITTFTLHQSTIDELKIKLESYTGRLREDITDAEVFDYIKEIEEADNHESLYYLTQYSAIHNFDEQWREPRSKHEIVSQLTAPIASWQAYI
jgi:hypothetical protein